MRGNESLIQFFKFHFQFEVVKFEHLPAWHSFSCNYATHCLSQWCEQRDIFDVLANFTDTRLTHIRKSLSSSFESEMTSQQPFELTNKPKLMLKEVKSWSRLVISSQQHFLFGYLQNVTNYNNLYDMSLEFSVHLLHFQMITRKFM